MRKPQWATMKVRFYMSTCWGGYNENDEFQMQGVNWINDRLMLLGVHFHNYFVQPFFETAAFPIKILEFYDGENH